MENIHKAGTPIRRRVKKRWCSMFFGRSQYRYFHRAIVVVLLAVLMSWSATAQIGTTVCVCSPSAYTLTFNFSRTCNDDSVTGNGIVTTDCAIAPFQNDNVTDLVPVSVASIDILELDEQLALVTQSSTFGTYFDGDNFNYTSISDNPSQVNDTFFPKALQISAIGNNADGETLFYAGLIVYATDCLAFPTIAEDSSIGWLTFSELEDPLPETCPLVGTRAPSSTIVPDEPAFSPTQISRSTKSPSQFRSTKAPSTYRSTKAPSSSPVQYDKGPTPVLSTKAPHTPAPGPNTHKPSCAKSSSSSKGSKGKGSKGSHSKSLKGKGKSKSPKGSKGKAGKGNSYDEDHYDNVFFRDECSSSKGGGKGHYYDDDDDDGVNDENDGGNDATAPTRAPITTAPTPTPSSKKVGSGDWSWEEHGDGIPTVQVDDFPMGAVLPYGSGENEDEVRDSVNVDQAEESSSKSGVDAAFGSSGAMYGVLIGGVVVAAVALWVWKRPNPEFLRCNHRGDDHKNMVIALVNKGLHGT